MLQSGNKFTTVNARAKPVSRGVVLKRFWGAHAWEASKDMVAEESCAFSTWKHSSSGIMRALPHNMGIVMYMYVETVWSMGWYTQAIGQNYMRLKGWTTL